MGVLSFSRHDTFLTNTATAQIKLAGLAVFPEKEHKDWLDVQHNPNLGAEEKIKSTINTFFVLIYESRKRGILLDSGFLFEMDDVSAYEDYAYERGLLFLRITFERHINIKLHDYIYHPDYHKIEIIDVNANVEITPDADIMSSDSPNIVNTSAYADYSITLVFKENSWLIQDVFNDDEGHQSIPRGIDYVARAKSNLYDIFSRRESQIITTKQREEKEKFLDIYRKLLGKFRFEAQGQSILISFSMRYDIIHGYWVEKDEETALYPIRNKELEFFAILDNGETYDFQFKMNGTGKLVSVVMKTNNIEYRGKRIAVK